MRRRPNHLVGNRDVVTHYICILYYNMTLVGIIFYSPFWFLASNWPTNRGGKILRKQLRYMDERDDDECAAH